MGIRKEICELKPGGSKERNEKLIPLYHRNRSQGAFVSDVVQTQGDVLTKIAKCFGNGARLGCHY